MHVLKSGLPAILGGERAVTLDQEQANRWPVITPQDEQAVLKILRDGDISTHPVIRELEEDYRAFTGMPYALAHCNGTAALLASFFALDLQPGDEVLVPSATFWASVLPMMWLGIVPVFCESEDERLGLDPHDMEKRITPRTRAAVIVHLWGMPSKMTEILAICERHNLKIIEDASHAQGATWRDRMCGTLGDVTVFSLQGGKLAPAGEGGIFLCRNYQYYERAICLGDITRIIELETAARRFAATSYGIKTRIAPVSAAIARGQLARLDENNRRRNDNLEYLSRHLENMGFDTFLPPPHIKRVYFEFIIRIRKDEVKLPVPILVKALQAEGCKASLPRYPLLHQQPFFTEGAFLRIMRPEKGMPQPQYLPQALPRIEESGDTLLSLPSFPNATRELLDQYVQAFEKVLHHSNNIAAKCSET